MTRTYYYNALFILKVIIKKIIGLHIRFNRCYEKTHGYNNIQDKVNKRDEISNGNYKQKWIHLK